MTSWHGSSGGCNIWSRSRALTTWLSWLISSSLDWLHYPVDWCWLQATNKPLINVHCLGRVGVELQVAFSPQLRQEYLSGVSPVVSTCFHQLTAIGYNHVQSCTISIVLQRSSLPWLSAVGARSWLGESRHLNICHENVDLNCVVSQAQHSLKSRGGRAPSASPGTFPEIQKTPVHLRKATACYSQASSELTHNWLWDLWAHLNALRQCTWHSGC